MSEGVPNYRETDQEDEAFPVEPRYHPVHRFTRTVYDALASSKLAMVLLVVILACCLTGVTLVRGAEAGKWIFGTLWFNLLLVLLIVNVACCFFGRIWGRRVTIVSFGMILFHLSFVTMFAGIIYNSLFYFRGSIRLTEGETLPSGDQNSYDLIERGRFFNLSQLKGETTLLKLHTAYKVGGVDKRAAYEVEVGEGSAKKQGLIYITKNLDYKGFRYFPDKEGYSILTVISDKQGKDLHGDFVPLQGLKQTDDAYLYTTGTKTGPGSFLFPQQPAKPIYDLQLSYRPDPKKERGGEVLFQVGPPATADTPQGTKPVAEGKAAVGAKFDAGDYFLSAREVRYWVGMKVNYEPGQPMVLWSLWVGLAGMVITTIGRIRRSRRSAQAQA